MGKRSPAALARKQAGQMNDLAQEYRKFVALQDFGNALSVARRAGKLTSDPAVIYDQAFCLLKLGRFQDSYDLFTRIRDPGSIAHCEMMTELCGQLGRAEDVAVHGAEALRLKHLSVAGEPRRALPAPVPPPFSDDDPSRNVIAYSLFGNSPRYCEVAVMNCDAARRWLPGWTCRFYVDGTVPAQVVARIAARGGEVVVLDECAQAGLHPLMWRFLVADDPRVARFLLRDADSLIGEREAAAVEAWCRSDRWFHVIRDWFTHCELMLAGLWGGCTGALRDMRGEISAFLRGGGYSPSHVDQHFLRARIWPTVSQSVLSHDSQFAFFNNEPLPAVAGARADGIHHIGANLSAGGIEGVFAAPDGTAVTWTLRDEEGQPVCSYDGVVTGNAWTSPVPKLYADDIAVGRWTVSVRVKT